MGLDAAGNVTEEPQTSVCDQMGKQPASGGCSDFHICNVASVRYPQDLGQYPHVKCINARALKLSGGPRLTPVQQDKDYKMFEAYTGCHPVCLQEGAFDRDVCAAGLVRLFEGSRQATRDTVEPVGHVRRF